jgi:hypothetical protein
VVDFDYVLDAVGQVSAVSKTGAAGGFFSRYGNGTQGLDTGILGGCCMDGKLALDRME